MMGKDCAVMLVSSEMRTMPAKSAKNPDYGGPRD